MSQARAGDRCRPRGWLTAVEIGVEVVVAFTGGLLARWPGRPSDASCPARALLGRPCRVSTRAGRLVEGSRDGLDLVPSAGRHRDSRSRNRRRRSRTAMTPAPAAVTPATAAPTGATAMPAAARMGTAQQAAQAAATVAAWRTSVGTPGRALTLPWLSCRTCRARRSSRCRGARPRLRAAPRDRRSGRWPDGGHAGRPGTSCRAHRARPAAPAHLGVATGGCCTGRCGGFGSTAGRAWYSDYPRGW